MKKYIPLILTSIMILGGCNASKEEDKSADRLVARTFYSYDIEKEEVESESTQIFFKANSEIPYINVKDAFEFINVIRKNKLGQSAYVKTVVQDKKATVTNDKGATCVLDAETQTITFADYDAFFHNDKTAYPFSLFDTSKIKSIAISGDHPQEYKKGHEVVIDLKPYSLIDIYQSGEELYIPVQTFSNLILSNGENMDIAYNMQDFFLVTEVTPIETELGGLKGLNDFGEKFYSGPKATTLDENYIEFYYQSINLNLDYTYGLKKEKNITSFDQFFTSRGYKNDMKSTDVHTLDNAFAYALSNLVDGHTAKSGTTPLYGYEEGNADRTKLNKDWLAFITGGVELQNAKKAKGIYDGLEIDQAFNTAYISFTDFTELNENLLYLPDELKNKDYYDLVNKNTQLLFNDAYKKITSTENKDKIKYVVVDLATNDGGQITSVVYGLCTLLGEIHISQINQLSGATSTTYFKADINADGKIDANDKSLAELGYNIVFLDSKYSFSSANAMPVFAKENNKNVTILGEKTAGGPCAIRNTFTAIGSRHTQSSITTLAKKQQDGSLIHIDGGVNPDIEVKEENMFDRTYLSSQMELWVKGN